MYNAIIPKVNTDEISWLQQVLTEKEFELFRKQLITEQRHALDVGFDILSQKSELLNKVGNPAYINLLKAALLHDCGKSLINVHLWQRVFIVIHSYFPDKIKEHISNQRNIFSNTIVIYKQHPSWGKHLAAKAGLNQEVQIMIENHHTPKDPLEKILFEADNRH